MSITEIIRFLLPDGNRVQWLFLVAMALLASSSAISVFVSARPRNWSKMWARHAETNAADFHADHGSINELSHAISTRAERFAEMVPGILLILGLLGTFLGLGVALNDAADLLANPPSDSGAMSGTMSGLTHMMSGLGTKFKTSAWGIIAFLSLKAWFAVIGFEDKRLQWCVERFNKTLAVARRAHREREDAAHDRLVNAVDAIGARYAASTVERRAEQSQIIASLAAMQASIDRNGRQAVDTHSMLDAHFRADLAQQSSSQTELLDLLAALKASIDTLGRQSLDTHAVIETRMREQVDALSATAVHTKETRASLEDFIAANGKNIDAMRDAGLQMSKGADDIARSAQALGEGVESFRQRVDETLGKMQEDLKSSIAEMNGSFQTSIGAMTEQLSGATKGIGKAAEGISEAVTNLSSGVLETLGEVSGMIAESSQKQRDALEEFQECGTGIQTSTENATGIMKNMAESIKLGLRSISDACLRMDPIVEKCTMLAGVLNTSSKSSQTQTGIFERLSTEMDVVSDRLKRATEAIEHASKNDRLEHSLDRLVDMSAQSQANFRKGADELFKLLEEINRSVQPAIIHDANAA
ncbi:hypothetical protein [Paraburkholderia bannensis]|uniref:hypothetical protein n=1 Tax=Paraburkholderia bannensis TaxID=765414 RepID=UPI002AB21210|nr:hypothetical protein [Paraburkholderia bannensis]